MSTLDTLLTIHQQGSACLSTLLSQIPDPRQLCAAHAGNDHPCVFSLDCPLAEEKDSGLYVIRPREDAWWRLYKEHASLFWSPEEIRWSEDKAAFAKLSPDEQLPIKMALCFFASADGIVGENIVVNFFPKVKHPSIRAFYGFQLAMEGIHGETYSDGIRALLPEPEQQAILSAMTTIPAVARMTKWAMKWMHPNIPFVLRLMAFAAVEGIMFSGAFCLIFWMKHCKKIHLPGLYQSNDLISRDEGLHYASALKLVLAIFEHCKEKIPERIVHIMIGELMSCVDEFSTQSLQVNKLGMNADNMSQYLRFVANGYFKFLEYTPLYQNIENPFDWMQSIGLCQLVNFFERAATSYAKHEMTNKLAKKQDHDGMQQEIPLTGHLSNHVDLDDMDF
jgi:ribonucleotide reductase beta subunit family protein with ferritin-like domain